MNRNVCLFSFWGWSLLLISLAGLPKKTLGQSTDYSALSSPAATDSSTAYWRLKTQAQARRTVVQFFAADHRLLYQEALPDRWVQLNRKNMKQLDELLAQLAFNQLVKERIKLEILPTDAARPRQSDFTGQMTQVNQPVLVNRPLSVHAFVNSHNKIQITVDNPRSQLLRIELANGDTQFFVKHTKLAVYNQCFDVSALAPGVYQIIVHTRSSSIIDTCKG